LLESRVGEVFHSFEQDVFVYYGINQRSLLAAKMLMDLGYSSVSNYADGFFVRRGGNLPVDAPDFASSSMLFKLP